MPTLREKLTLARSVNCDNLTEVYIPGLNIQGDTREIDMSGRNLGRFVILTAGAFALIIFANVVTADACVKIEERNGMFMVVNYCSYTTSGKYCWISDESPCDCKKGRVCAWTKLEPGQTSAVTGPGTDEQRRAVWKWCPYDQYIAGECTIDDPSSGY